MNLHKVMKRVICCVLTLGMVFSSTSFEGITIKAASVDSQSVVREGEYTTGVFSGCYGIDQLFDYIMSTGRLNALPYDASWGSANDSEGQQLTTEIMKERYFVLKYSGDEDYPIALCLYDENGTPVVVDQSDRLLEGSRIGLEKNVTLTATAKKYMKETYADGVEGVMALCKVGKADSNGMYFISKNKFGYYLSGNQGRGIGEKIVWESTAKKATVKELAAMTDYSSHQLTAGEFAVMYQANGEAVTDMPEDQVKQGGQPLTLSSKVPKRSGYTFTGWNTRADGSGTTYAAGGTYTSNRTATMYATWDRHYESGLFKVKLSSNQFFDNVTSANKINGYPYDASWGTANASRGHQYSEKQVKDRYFIFRYSGDDRYPFALFMYEKNDKPVVAGTSKNLPDKSLVGTADNVCSTAKGKKYMNRVYEDGIKGLLCMGKVTKYDENGIQFVSSNGFGYYMSCNRGYKKGDYIAWEKPVTNGITPEVMDAVDTFSDKAMADGEYALNYNVNTTDKVIESPNTQCKEDTYNSVLTVEEPKRAGYEFIGWNTKKDGTGDMYEAGSRYEGEKTLTMYATWKKKKKTPLSVEENGEPISKIYRLSNRTAIAKAVKNADDADTFYNELNQATMVRHLDIKGGASEDDVFTAVSSKEDILDCSVEGTKLTLIGKNEGFAYVTITDETTEQIYRLSVYVTTLKDALYIIRPVTADSYKSYLADNDKASYAAKAEVKKNVKWTQMNTSNQTVKQLSNGDAVVWKLGTSYRDVGVTCGVCKSEVPLEDLKSGESDGSYPINIYPVSSTYKQNVTLKGYGHDDEDIDITVRSFIVDLDGNVIASANKTEAKKLSRSSETITLEYEDVQELKDADVLVEVTAKDDAYAAQLVRYPLYRDGYQENTGTSIWLQPCYGTNDCVLTSRDQNYEFVRDLTLYKGYDKKVIVYSQVSQKHTVSMFINDKEIPSVSESVASVDGMKYEWKQTEFAINTKNAAVGKFTPQYQIKAASGEVLADQPADYTVCNISEIGKPAKPTEVNFCGTIETPQISAGEVINRKLSFNIPKVLPMKIAYQDTDNPLKKTFMVAIGTAGLDENNVVSVVTETINDLRDNKVSKTLSGYAFGTADYIDGKWILTYTGGGIAGTLGYEFGFNNNTMVGIIPIYYGIKVGCTVSVDALLSGQNPYHDKFVGMNFQTNNLTVTSEYNFVSDILVGVEGYVCASGGIGFDGKIVKIKFGPVGRLSIGYDNRIVTFSDLKKTKAYYGGCLNFTGSISLDFEYKGLFIRYHKQICGTGFSKVRTYQDWDKFPAGRPNPLDFANMSNETTGKVVRYSSKKKGADWTQYINPDVPPVLAANGNSMALTYSDTLEDLVSINPAVSTKESGEWTKPEVLTSWRTEGKSETVNSVDYASDGSLKVLAFDSAVYDSDIDSDGNVDSKELNATFNSSEIHVYVNGKHTTLTANNVADMAPEVAVNNGKAIVVWQSDTYNLADTDAETLQKDMMGEKKICYSYYDGTDWSAPAYLERGEIKGAQAYDVALSDDGTAMVLATMGSSEEVQERELYSYIVKDGAQKSVNRITCNDAGETQPRVKYVTNDGGMFLAAWKQSEYKKGELTDSYLALQGYQKDGSANAVSMKDSGEVTENFDFAKGGDTISDTAVYWQSAGDDSKMHTYVKYLNAKTGTLSMQYEITGTASANEMLVGGSVVVDGDRFTTVSCAQTSTQSETTKDTDLTQTKDEEQPARLITGTKTIQNELSEVSADTFGQNVEQNSTINVTLSFANAGRKAMDSVTVKQSGTTVADALPIHLESGERGQVSFSYTLGNTLQNETFEVAADNGATAKAQLTLLGTDMVLGNPEVVENLQGGERIVQVVISNAGTKALTEDDTIRVALTSVDKKAVTVKPTTAGASFDEDKKLIVISGKDAMEAINRGEYVLQFNYTPKFTSEAKNVSISLQATAYNGSAAAEELNLIDNTAAFSIVKPSKQYDRPLTFTSVIEDGKLKALDVYNRYEKKVARTIIVSNGIETKKINVTLGAEEGKTYDVGMDATPDVSYEMEGDDPVVIPTPEPEDDPNVTPSPSGEPTQNPVATVKPTKRPVVKPTKRPVPTQTVKPTHTPLVRPTVKPSDKPKKAAPKIVVGKARFLSVKNKASKKLVISMKVVARANGYCVQYSTNKKFKKAKTKLTKKRKLTIKKLKKKKTYYIRVRAYRLDEKGKKIFGPYSKTKKIKIKK